MTDTTDIPALVVELKRLAEAATQGRWRAGPKHIVRCEREISGGIHAGGRLTIWIAEALKSGGNPDGDALAVAHANAAFIAAANPAAVLTILAHLSTVEEERNKATNRESVAIKMGQHYAAQNDALGVELEAAERELAAGKTTIAGFVEITSVFLDAYSDKPDCVDNTGAAYQSQWAFDN